MTSPIRKARYRVTGLFDLSPVGEVRTAIVLNEDVDEKRALLFHPVDPATGGCGSLEMAREVNGVFEAMGNDDMYINLGAEEEAAYRARVRDAGVRIPRKLVLEEAPKATRTKKPGR